jgi:hypothetical protein
MYYLSECLIIKNENQYLLEHLEKNYQGGIEFFYIYDNESEQPVEEYLKNNAPIWLDRCKIEIFPRTERIQVDCYSKFLKDHRDDTVWCAFFDTDEIIEGDLKKFCKEHENYLSLDIYQIMHGSNGVIYADYTKTMTEQFKDHVLRQRHMIKCVSQVKYIMQQINHHTFLDLDVVRNSNPEIPKEYWEKKFKAEDIKDIVQLHHYFQKSFEEWCIKLKRGRITSQKESSGWSLELYFIENEVPEKDLNFLLEKYDLTMDFRSRSNSIFNKK